MCRDSSLMMCRRLGLAVVLALLTVSVTGAAFGMPLGTESAEQRDVQAGMEDAGSMTQTLSYEIYINATPEQVWNAITDPEWTVKYGYQGRVGYDLKPGGAFRAYATPAMVEMGMPEVVVDGEVLEVDPRRKLVQTYRFLFGEANKAEGFSTLSWEIADTEAGFTRLTLTHDVSGAPIMSAMVSSQFSLMGTGGWSWILSDMKSVLETGKALGAE